MADTESTKELSQAALDDEKDMMEEGLPDAETIETLMNISNLVRSSLRETREATESLASNVRTILDIFESRETIEDIDSTINTAAQHIQETTAFLVEYLKSDRYKAILQGRAKLDELTPDMLKAADDHIQAVQDLLPYIRAILDETQADLRLGKATIVELSAVIRGEGDPDSPWRAIIERAKADKEEFETAQKAAKALQELPTVVYSKGASITVSGDKFANLFFSPTAPLPKGEINGQRTFIPVKYERNGSKKELTLSYDYRYDESVLKRLAIKTGFSDYDFFVMTVLDNLYREGNSIVSLNKIFHELGYESNEAPGNKNIEKLYKSLIKGMSTIITMDDRDIQDAWHGSASGTYRDIVTQVMPIQISNERYRANGRIASSTVKINSFSPFGYLSDTTRHISTWDKKVLRMYTGRKTDRYFSVMRYLMVNIGWIRAPKSKRSNRLMYKGLYESVGDKSFKDRQHTRDMLYRLLDEVFVPAGYVKCYEEVGEGVMLTCSKSGDREKLQ